MRPFSVYLPADFLAGVVTFAIVVSVVVMSPPRILITLIASSGFDIIAKYFCAETRNVTINITKIHFLMKRTWD